MSRTDHHTDVLTVAASTDNLAVIRDFVLQHLVSMGFTEYEENGIVLAVDEACSNLIKHAYRNDASKTIRVEIHAEEDTIEVRIQDTSAPFDPKTSNLPHMPSYLAERRAGGLGILLMTRVMDSIDYVPADATSHFNTLTLTKRRSL